MNRSPFPYMTVVDTAATSKDLTVKARVKLDLDITVTTYDDLIDTNIHEVSSKFAEYCDRELASEKVTHHYYVGYGSDTIWVRRRPITTVHAIVEDGVALDSALYEVNAQTGEIYRLDTSGERICWTCGKITVQVTGGFTLLTNLPNSLESACVEEVKRAFLGRDIDKNVLSETVPDVHQISYAMAGGKFVGKSGFLVSTEDVLDNYRDWAIA